MPLMRESLGTMWCPASECVGELLFRRSQSLMSVSWLLAQGHQASVRQVWHHTQPLACSRN
jgi:hypothetical protein